MPARRQQAATPARLHTFVAATHNTRLAIAVLVLQALLDHAEGDEPAALQALEQAVTAARLAGFLSAIPSITASSSPLSSPFTRSALVEP